MTPEFIAFLGTMLEKYGLPLAGLVALSWALFTRRIVMGSETNYTEARRVEEREARLAAEAETRAFTASLDKLSDSLEGMVDQLLAAFEEGPRAPRR